MKYKRITNSIMSDYQTYLAQEGLYNIMYGERLATRRQRRKAGYIWKRLLKLYGYIKWID